MTPRQHTLPLLAALLLTPLAAIAVADTQAQPNIIFIYADDWGWGDLSCHGHAWLKTPNIDTLAAQGTDFQQFNVLNPVCSPSRTAHFGWHLTKAQVSGAPKPEAYGCDASAVFNGGAGWGKPEALHETANDTVAFIKAIKSRPFFINVWIHESHTPHLPTAESMEKWKHLDPQKQVYSAVITDGDNAVGTILDALKAEGVENNTIVMFGSDNGPEQTAAKDSSQKTDPDAQVTGYGTFYSIGQTGGLRGGKRKLVMAGDAQRVELYHLARDRAEAEDVSQDHSDLVARLSQMALAWKATLPTKPNPECLSTQPLPERPTPGEL